MFKINSEITISDKNEPFIIAEAGINHDGEFEKAIELVDLAIDSGASAIKFQTHITDKEMIPTDMKPGNISEESLWDIIDRCVLDNEQERSLFDYAKEKGILFFSTPFSREGADRLNELGVELYKIGSGECNNYPLIEHISEFGKPIILSTGMNDIQSISKSVNIFEKHGIPYALLHTTNIYPTSNNLVRLGAMVELQKEFPNAVVGLSDHTITNHACFGAVALGASILERHFTDSMSREGPTLSAH